MVNNRVSFFWSFNLIKSINCNPDVFAVVLSMKLGLAKDVVAFLLLGFGLPGFRTLASCPPSHSNNKNPSKSSNASKRLEP